LEFDPVLVGYETKEFKDGFKLDATLKGNSIEVTSSTTRPRATVS
jgi:hypothetical protein